FFWSWALVALGQFIVALNFAEVSAHFPVAGSVYQWTKYLSSRPYSWITGWIYLFAGVLTVTAVVATIPGLVLIPLLNNLGLTVTNNAQTQVAIALVILASITLLNIFGVRLVALINNTGVVFEILGMVVFALVLLIFYHHQSATVVFDSSYLGSGFTGGAVLAAIYVCCLAILTSTIRLAFGMARDGKLPLARYYNKVSPTLHTPVGVCIVVGVLAAVPFLYYSGAGTIAISATGMIYLSYLLGNLAILIARVKGWPKENAPFKLGGWGTIVNVLALVWGGSMLVNFLWPRPGSIINPSLSALPNIPDLSPLGNIPIRKAPIGVVEIFVTIYYF